MQIKRTVAPISYERVSKTPEPTPKSSLETQRDYLDSYNNYPSSYRWEEANEARARAMKEVKWCALLGVIGTTTTTALTAPLPGAVRTLFPATVALAGILTTAAAALDVSKASRNIERLDAEYREAHQELDKYRELHKEAVFHELDDQNVAEIFEPRWEKARAEDTPYARSEALFEQLHNLGVLNTARGAERGGAWKNWMIDLAKAHDDPEQYALDNEYVFRSPVLQKFIEKS